MKSIETICRALMLLASINLSLFASICVADELDGRFRITVKNTIIRAWSEGMRPGEKMGSNSTETDRVPAVVEAVSSESIRCYRDYASGFDDADVGSFEALISKYSDLLDTPNWERKVDNAIDARYGNGASLLKGKCEKDKTTSRECRVERSYDVIWARLYVKLFSCVLENSQNIPKLLRSAEK